ncbi:hypothetical protein ERO13_D06G017500v2 [Gossypium hirsutum]|uniref:Uncharacterized protein LOC107944685 isoform X1 n=2 Tax=Gossypium TaxID=3633 RepID=A0A1U8N4I4_GOSHI|nr:uncharacterized protein LOC107944685 isoform X1 [Gossypium hirsutum]XP_016734002.1 uncharacterized protein LOC107944685 isoform X1 [Gossypium hirsutum]KAG4140413.1 hypothetical protein ERO13_D06G017500v2 [Gossypium hirsutum]TYH64962.1 hypothetical protein ES332_D06G023600v1 [Gossypium tomentosum]TYH64963.1 hypothetical protein ES332_D06G023600v1 [Gossypium tomentosum]
MAEQGFQEQSTIRSSYRARDASPDSVIFTPESNFSLFSSASASVDRCSFASDAHDHDSLASELSLHLAGHERGDQNESLSGPDSNTNKANAVLNHSRFSRKGEKVKVEKDENDTVHVKDENQLIDSARNSFSLATKDCKDRKIRSEASRIPTSLDLNNVSASSPRLGTMKKSSVSTRKSGAFPSPGTPNYHHHNNLSAGMQKGSSSERVPLHNNGVKRQGNVAGMLPCNNGRTLPSKWENAERWILSPGDSGVKQSVMHPQRRPKSKSGPLGPPGAAYNSLYSPSMYIFDGGNMGNFMAGSPFSAGIISANGLVAHSRSHGGGFAVRTEPCMARSVSVHGCSEVVSPPSLPSQDADENLDMVKDAATDISRTVSRRDMATQMSPQGSTCSSTKESASFSLSTPSPLPIMELQSIHASKSEVRDVQIDERVTMTRWSKKHRAGNTAKSSEIVDDWRKKAADTRTPTWDVTETAKCVSTYEREEAKITAWENLQKAKAEAAIRKLEMKLEKKRSSSMDKIMNKLRSAQRRAQEMRSSMLSNQSHQVTRTSRKAIPFHGTSLTDCFTCLTF